MPGELVAARAEAMAKRDQLLAEQKLIKQRKSRQKDLRIRHKNRIYENYTKEAALGTTSRRPPAIPKEQVGK